MARSGAGEDRREAIDALTDTFDKLVSALNEGGRVEFEDGGCLDLPPPSDPETAVANQALRDSWISFVGHQKRNLNGLADRERALADALDQVAPATIHLKGLARRLRRVDEEEYEGHLELVAMAEADFGQSRSRIYKLDALEPGDELEQTELALSLGLDQALEQLDAIRDGSDEFDIDPLDDDVGMKTLAAANASLREVVTAVGRFTHQKQWQIRADEEFQAAVLSLEAAESSMASLEVKASQELLMRTRMMQLALLSTAILAALMAAMVTLRGAIANLRRTGDLVSGIAEGDGDLTVRLDLMRSDEIGALGSAFDRFVERVQGMVSDVASVVVRVGSSANSVENVAVAVGQSTRTTVETSDALSETVTSLSDELHQVRQQVKEQSTELAGSVNATLTTANATKQDLIELGERTKEIERIINSVQAASSEVRLGIERVTESVSAVSDQQTRTSSEIEEQLGGFGRHFESLTSASSDLKAQMNQVTDQAGTHAGEAKALTAVADELKNLVGQFRYR